jgi:hypothetical protein
MVAANATELTGPQQLLMRWVIQEASRSGRPASELLLLRDVPAEDRAAVAEELSPDAGKDYL